MADQSAGRSGAVRSFNMRTLVVIVLLCALCAGSCYVHFDSMNYYIERSDTIAGTSFGIDAESVQEARELESLAASYTKISDLTSGIMRTAMLSEVSERLPVALASILVPPEPEPEELAAAGQGPEVEEYIPPEYELDPPTITVTTIMISGREKMAVIDILGEESDMIVREGDQIMGGTVVITNIDEKGVTFRWMERTFGSSIQ